MERTLRQSARYSMEREMHWAVEHRTETGLPAHLLQSGVHVLHLAHLCS
jgi:hypothetical protein